MLLRFSPKSFFQAARKWEAKKHRAVELLAGLTAVIFTVGIICVAVWAPNPFSKPASSRLIGASSKTKEVRSGLAINALELQRRFEEDQAKKRERFLDGVKHVVLADLERVRLISNLASTARSQLSKIENSPIPDTFIETVTSWTSMFKFTIDSAAHEGWIAEKFNESVLSASDLQFIIKGLVEQFQRLQADIDNRVLVKLELDVDHNPSATAIARVDLTSLNALVQKFHGSIRAEMIKSIQSTLISTGVSTVAGELGSLGAAALMSDAKGSLPPEAQIATVVVGFGVGYVVDNLVSQALSSEDDIRNKCVTVKRHLLTRVDPYYDDGKLWFDAARQHSRAHCQSIWNLFVSATDVNPEWAIEQYQRVQAEVLKENEENQHAN